MLRQAHFGLRPARLVWVAAAAALIGSAATAVRRLPVVPVQTRLVPVQARPRARDLAAGKILVARRSLVDPNFAETVILLVQHDDDGTAGLIINRQTKIPLSKLSQEMDSAKGRTDRLYHGGPVQPAGIMALLRSRTTPEDAKAVVQDLYVISSKAALEKTVASGAAASTFRIYLGYAGWDAGQLAWELKMNAWDVLPANPAVVFDAHPETLWPRLAAEESMQLAFWNPGYRSGAACCRMYSSTRSVPGPM
jgi:putative transcriptional regulator